LPPAAARLGVLAARPKIAAVLCIVLLAGAGWLYLGLVAGAAGSWTGWLGALCRPAATPLTAGVSEFAFVLAMWCAMALAMMLPSAAPMILTYAEIADTAGRKGEQVVSPFALALGYAAVWIGFSFCAALLQFALIGAVLLDTNGAPAARYLSAVLFVLAGAYQFSSLKQVCLSVCQRPFPFFFANWRTTVRGVFALGVRQGLHSHGCCWAMMTLMFVAGLMNAVWMAGLGLVMTIEKMSATPRFSHAVGLVLIAAGIALGGYEWFGAA
jgi:predicted metal-binding membrane protein